jgi:hypothetical protein
MLHKQVESFSASGTWVCPAGVTSATVEAWGAGGGSLAGTGSGGGGAYARSVLSVTPSTSYTITIGTSAVDTNGGDSSFGSSVIAQGGRSASNGGTGGQASASTGDVKYNGGNGQMGTGNRTGGGAAGENGAASGSTPGEPSGGGFAVTSFFISGAHIAAGAGVGSSGTTQSAGRNGYIRISYDLPVDPIYPYISARGQGRSTVSQTSHTVPMPSGIESGDLLFVIFSVTSETSQDLTASGWTREQLAFSDSVLCTLAVFSRVATGTNTFTTTTSGTGRYGRSQWWVIAVKNSNNLYYTGTSAFTTSVPLVTTPKNKPHLWIQGYIGIGNYTNIINAGSNSNFVSKTFQGYRLTSTEGGISQYIEDAFITGTTSGGRTNLSGGIGGNTFAIAIEGITIETRTHTIDTFTATRLSANHSIDTYTKNFLPLPGFQIYIEQ